MWSELANANVFCTHKCWTQLKHLPIGVMWTRSQRPRPSPLPQTINYVCSFVRDLVLRFQRWDQFINIFCVLVWPDFISPRTLFTAKDAIIGDAISFGRLGLMEIIICDLRTVINRHDVCVRAICSDAVAPPTLLYKCVNCTRHPNGIATEKTGLVLPYFIARLILWRK